MRIGFVSRELIYYLILSSIYILLSFLWIFSIDSNDVEVEIHGGGGGQPGAPLSSSPNAGGIAGLGLANGEYDYTTALTVTLTVGVCLILLNLVVFSAIMCHRKRGFNIPVNLVDNGSRRSSHSGTPQKSTYQVCACPAT